jgi:DNA repair exonuclease SbcCD ATPase subunit
MEISHFVPETLYIKNFNNISDLRVDFSDIVVITGKNGSGKTSIIDAFAYCITGQLTRDVPVAEIIKKGEKSATVKITGTYNGDPVEIIRTRAMTSQKLTVFVSSGGEKTEITDPKSFLESIATFPEFVNLFFINGHQLSRFASAGSKETSEMIDDMFKIGTLDAMRKELNSGISRADKDMKVSMALADSLASKKELADQSKKIAGREIFDRRIADTTGKIAPLEQELATLSSKISMLRDRLKDRDALLASIRDAENRVASANNKVIVISQEIDSIKARIAIDEKDFSGAGGDAVLASLEKEIDSAKKTIAAIDAEFTARKDLPALLQKIVDMVPGGSNCPVCATPGARDIAMKNLNSMASTNKNVLSTLLSRKSNLTKEIATKETTIRKATSLKNDLMSSRRSLESLSAKMSEARKEADKLQGSKPLSRESIEQEKSAVEQELIATAGKAGNIDASIQSLSRDIKDARAAIAEIDRLSAEQWSPEKETELATARAEIDRIKARSGKLLVLKSACTDVLSSIRERIMNTLTPSIMKCIASLSLGESAITKFEVVPRVKTIKGEQHYYYDFKVEVNGVEVPFDSLSTGQRALIMISFILSVINFSASALSAIFFDEVDSCGLDRNYIQSVLKAIAGIAGSMKVVFVSRDKATIEAMKQAGQDKGFAVPVIEMPSPRRGT